MKHNNISTIGDKQQGAVLIVVLLFLVLITLAGVMSVKNSNSDLRVATSDQINTVLLQSADSVNSKLERQVNADVKSRNHQRVVIESAGVLGHFINDRSGLSDDDRIATCFRTRDENFIKSKSTVHRDDLVIGPNEGYCDPSSEEDYTGARTTTMTQVLLTKVDGDEAYTDAFAGTAIGTNTEASTSQKSKFDVHSTSVLPAFGSASAADVKKCIGKAAALVKKDDADDENKNAKKKFDNKEILKCFNENDIIGKQLVERIEVANKYVSEYCTMYGGVDGISKSDLCPDS